MRLKAKGLKPSCCQEWLKGLSAESIEKGEFPLQEILRGSLYYPACNIDGGPIRCFGHYVQSFIYADYGVEKERIIKRLQRFKDGGYDLIGLRDLTEPDLTPNGWNPQLPSPDELKGLQQHKDLIKPPFAFWSVFQRQSKFGEDHGPERFSLLYIAGDGVATYQAIFHGNKTFPDWLAIIQPGTGFGGNWTDFHDENGPLSRVVLHNPYGQPKYLLYGGHGTGYTKPCWKQYSQFIYCISPYRASPKEGEVRLWSKSGKRGEGRY